MKQKYFYFFSFLLFVTIPAGANMIHFKEISLKQLLNSTQMILVVAPAKPARKTITIPFWCGFKRRVFEAVLYRYIVQEVLYNPEALDPGPILEVHDSEEDTELYLSRLYNCEKRSKSPIYDVYDRDIELSPTNQLIIFIKRMNGKNYFTVQGGAAEITDRDNILQALGELKQGQP